MKGAKLGGSAIGLLLMLLGCLSCYKKQDPSFHPRAAAEGCESSGSRYGRGYCEIQIRALYVTQQTQIDRPGKEGLNLELSMSQAKVGNSCEGSSHLNSRGVAWLGTLK
ncbi:hypothetical protein BGZ57DRAFT_998248 [Hyaloscypha finlandica]|nr:hypothetical protein BGZ57DRAFT_998248 [Hyaloscypha finlandica]